MRISFPAGVILGPVFTGKAMMRWNGKPPSAISKQRVHGRIRLTKVGLRGDEQADLSVHGGLEKALHHYAADHYSFWKESMPDSSGKFEPGGFGENVSTVGLTEEHLCIGDVLQLGGAIVQISQGRQPCWKLSAHIQRDDMAAQFQKSRRVGWYYRVLQEGYIESGARVALADRPQPDWPLPVVIAARFDPQLEPDKARQLAMIGELSASWREGFRRKSDRSYVEDTAPRLTGK